jgi:hypothetical protein
MWSGSLQLLELKLDGFVLAIGIENVDFGVVGRHVAGVILNPDSGADQTTRSGITVGQSIIAARRGLSEARSSLVSV